MSSKFQNDKYYTPEHIVNTCFDALSQLVDFSAIPMVIEPSAGDGAFIGKIKESFPNAEKIFLDLYPESDMITCQDFLKFSAKHLKNILVIGNPPFGSRGNGFVKFFNNAIKFADYIAFILPISQFENSGRLYKFDLISSTNLGKIDFYYKDKHKEVECCFNIYKRPVNGLNIVKKIKFDGIDIRQLCKDVQTYTNSDRYASNIIRLCGWGKAIGYIKDQNRKPYALEYIIKTKNHEVSEYIKTFNWNDVCSKTATPSLSQHHITNVLALRFPQLVIF